jgi:hypothetical protein
VSFRFLAHLGGNSRDILVWTVFIRMKPTNQTSQIMKKIIVLASCLPVLAFVLAHAQPVSNPPTMPTPNQAGQYVWVPETTSLSKFDLNFAGGTPEQLVKAVEKATDKPLNAIIPDDCKNLEIPAFSVKNVTVADLFAALLSASEKTEHYMEFLLDRNISHTSDVSSYGFRTEGQPNINSIWYFSHQEPSPEQPISHTICTFYQLEPYLDAGYKVGDITAAVETAWKMLGIANTPELTYRNQTKLLIAVGKENQVAVIDNVLKQLAQGRPSDKAAGIRYEKSE